ncbi:MAG: hypothetical protein EOM85_03900 [Candidatus Moranbacteria bacterium]|nr:hypothetical protein [Candidatus Moranbacteria bacterium]
MTILILGTLLTQSCDKDKPPVSPPITYTVTINVIGKIHVTLPQKTGITPGSNIDITIEPDSLYSVYSIKENGVNMNISHTDKKFTYSLKNIQSNKILDIEAIETGIINLSVLEPPLMLKKIAFYRAKDDKYLGKLVLDQLDLSRKYYHYYPSMDIKVINPDGAVFWQQKWSLKQGVYKRGDQTLTVVQNTDKILELKDKPSFDPTYGDELYMIYTYGRN